MRKLSIFGFAVTLILFLLGQLNAAGQFDDKEHAELAQGLKSAKVSLEKGLAARASQSRENLKLKTESSNSRSTR